MVEPSEPEIGVRPGEVIAGKYRVERVLGRGGMGVVVAAHHIQLDERVAIKFLLPDALESPEAVARFVREARVAVKIKSEHAARVSDVGQLDDGAPYMVLEYLEGVDLSDWLRESGLMPPAQAVDFVLQACEALAEAHALGIVHRDLKPSNLFCIVRADGELSVKLLDFGISKFDKPGSGHGVTTTTAVVGSPAYMSPEQLRAARDVDARTDIWSLGVILFELLTARLPFDAEVVTELVIQIATAPAPSVRTLQPGVPRGLDDVIATCLNKDRGDRFASIGDLAVALQPFGSPQAAVSVQRIVGTLRSTGVVQAAPATGQPPLDSRPSLARLETMATWGRTEARAHKRPATRAALWAGAALSMVVVVVAAVAFSLRGRPQAAIAPNAPSASQRLPVAAATEKPSAAPSVEPSSAPPAIAATDLPLAAPARGGGQAPRGAATSTHASSATAAAPAPAARSTAAPSAAGCDPPFTLDERGRKHFKLDCYQNK
jgi:serine/threonine-protein kinase